MNEQPLRAAGPGVGRALLTAVGAIVLLLVGVVLGRASAQPASTPATSATTATSAAPTAAPTPQALSGTGSKVVPVTLAAGRYKLAWTAQGSDNFIVKLLGQNTVGVVNEIPPNPTSGETVLSVQDSGNYQMQVEASTLTWTITLTPL